MKFAAIVSMSFICAVTAQAGQKRVLVMLKSAAQFDSASHEMEAPRAYPKPGTPNAGLKFMAIRGHLEKKLKHLNSLVMVVDAKDEDRLRARTDVAFVEEERMHAPPQPVIGYQRTADLAPPSQLMASPAAEIGVEQLLGPAAGTPWGIMAIHSFDAWPQAHRGEGARVMILDSGLDKDHPAIAANFEQGKDFVGDGNQPYEFADQVGHGTHVAGTIAATAVDAGFTGVAPKAKILSGRVCATKGCSSLWIVAGIEWAIEQKVDVISMSLGSGFATLAEREAISRAAEAGITVVAAAGNDGTGHVSYPAALPDVIAVGAVDSQLAHATFSEYGPELAVVAPGVDVMSSVPRGTGRDPDVEVSIAGSSKHQLKTMRVEGSDDRCVITSGEVIEAGHGSVEDFQKVDVKGKIALVKRGEVYFIDKTKNAIAAGAAGLIVYNIEPGLQRGALTQDGTKFPLPVYLIEQAAGEQLLTALAAKQPVFAQVGLVPTDYRPLDGTSMATPHVSGVVALIRAANKNLAPWQIKEILKHSATALSPNLNNVFGAGIVNADAAVREALLTTGLPPKSSGGFFPAPPAVTIPMTAPLAQN